MNRILPLLALLAVLASTACDTGPNPGNVRITLENAWPNEDGNYWNFDTILAWEGYEGDGADWNGLPPFDELYEELQAAIAPDPTGMPEPVTVYTTSLWFDGEITTDSGVTGQNLTARSFLPDKAEPATSRGLLARIAEMRPDLRPALEARYGALPADSAKDDPFEVIVPFFLGDGCWERTEDAIIGYGDLDPDPSWVYLHEPLTAGATVTHQLVPAIADDIWLHVHHMGRRVTVVDGVTYVDAREILSVVDLGEMILTDDQGNLVGMSHPYMTAVVTYVPTVGPVGTAELSVMHVVTAYDPEGYSLQRIIAADLTDHGNVPPGSE